MTGQTAQRGHEAPAAAQPAITPTFEEIAAVAEDVTELLDGAALDVAVAFVKKLWVRWGCGDEHCPGLPPQDVAFDALINDDGLAGVMMDAASKWLIARGLDVAQRFPDAPRPVR